MEVAGRRGRWSPVIAYITSYYPAVSHTFILREVRALRRRGRRCHYDFGAHAPARVSSRMPTVRNSRTRMHCCRRDGSQVAKAHLNALVRHPRAFFSTLRLSLKLSRPGARGRLWQVFYFGEAVIAWDHWRQAGRPACALALRVGVRRHRAAGEPLRQARRRGPEELERHRSRPDRALGRPVPPADREGQARGRDLLHQRLHPQPADGGRRRGPVAQAARRPVRDRARCIRRRRRTSSGAPARAVRRPARAGEGPVGTAPRVRAARRARRRRRARARRLRARRSRT